MNGVQLLAASACLLVAVCPALGRVYDQCDLARELVDRGLSRDQINDWICLVNSESAFDTAAKGGPNSDDSYDYGLFQINDAYWCSAGDAPGKECNIRCADLLDDDISDDVECTKKIFGISGFAAWNGWKSKCQGDKSDMSSCFS